MPHPESGDDKTVIIQRRPSGTQPPSPPGPPRSEPGSQPPRSGPPRSGPPWLWLALGVAILAAAGGGWLALRPTAPPATVATTAPTTATATAEPVAPSRSLHVPQPQPPAAPAPVPALAPPPAPPAAPVAPAQQAQTPPAQPPQTQTPPAPQAPAAQIQAPPPAAPPPAAPPTVAAPAAPPPAPFALQTGDEAAILTHAADSLTVFRFAPAGVATNIVVLDFPNLLEQGLTLDRVAALVEKAGEPHDRVLNDAELEAAIKRHGDTVGSYYYGHDYTAAHLARFFALADQAGIGLNPQEQRLRALARQLGWLSPAPPAGALLSFSRAGADADITPAARAVILHHELSHGAFFTEPRYAAYVRGFWQSALSEKERAALRHFLVEDGYEPGDEELTVNEMQAYLMFTHDREFFDIAAVGLTAARRKQLEAAFRHGIPDGWIKAMPPVAPALAAAPVAAALHPAATSPACGPGRSCP